MKKLLLLALAASLIFGCAAPFEQPTNEYRIKGGTYVTFTYNGASYLTTVIRRTFHVVGEGCQRDLEFDLPEKYSKEWEKLTDCTYNLQKNGEEDFVLIVSLEGDTTTVYPVKE